MKNIKRIIALFTTIFVLTTGTYVYSINTTGVYCKDCGSETNCLQASGLDNGYQACEIEYNGNGNAVGCEVDPAGYGDDCQQYNGPPMEDPH